jgi:RimJ/RimL family protein N-acetyltransferase
MVTRLPTVAVSIDTLHSPSRSMSPRAALDTVRLHLAPCAPDDFADYAEMWADPEVTRYLSADGRPLSRFHAWRSFAAHIGHWSLRGFGMFTVTERQTGTFVGQVGPWQPEGWPGFEIGWTLQSRFWGRGYATEAARACIEHAFTELDQPHVISLITTENARSIRVAERVGERLQREVVLPHLGDRPVRQYGLSRDDWRAHR